MYSKIITQSCTLPDKLWLHDDATSTAWGEIMPTDQSPGRVDVPPVLHVTVLQELG